MKIKDPIQFIYRMETVLDIYKRPYDPRFPVVCTDETTKQLIKEICRPLPMSPGHGERIDYEYERNGVGHLIMFFEPLGGTRQVFVETSHTKRVWVYCLKELMGTKYKDAERVTLVMDNLAVHSPAAFYEFLPAEEAQPLIGIMSISVSSARIPHIFLKTFGMCDFCIYRQIVPRTSK